MAGNVQRRADGRWRGRYRDAAGREHARHFDRKLDAVRWLASVEVARRRGEWVDPNLSRIRFGEWAEIWLAGQVQLKPSTRDRYQRLLLVQILPTWERVPLSAVSHAEVVAWVGRMSAAGLSPATVRQAHRVMALVLDLAVRDGRLARNAAAGVRLPRLTRQEPVFLSHAQVAALAEAAGSAGLLIRLLSYTGLRWGELAALRVRRVDLPRRRLEVAESVTEIGGQAVFGTPKTHQRRWVPLPRSLVEPLGRQLAGKGPDDLVFPAPEGGVLRNHNFRSRVFDPAVAAAGCLG